jgi:hypothetical protein
LNVAVPFTAATGVVPLSTPALGFVPMEMDTFAVEVVGLLNASRICTVTGGEMACPTTVLLGCCPKTTLFGAAAAMLKGLDVAKAAPLLVAFRV